VASNQTPQKYQVLVRQGNNGTGVFLRVGASGETLVTFEPNLSYEACVQVGQGFAAFKWIPASVSSYASVVNSRCRLVGEACLDSCDADGCLCNAASQQCADASGNSQLPPPLGGSNAGDLNDEPAVVEISGQYLYR
jgi:hypothetical protein